MSLTARASNAANTQRQRLRDLIRERSMLTGQTFTLASGRTSGAFFDMKKTMFDPEGANLIADQIFDLIRNENVNAVGGLEMGAVPVVLGVVQKSFREGRPIKGFFVRKEVKDHGTQQKIDGLFEPNARVIMFDDVTTTGGSVLKAVRAARERGCTVDKVVTVVDRQEGAAENLAREGIELVALFKKDDFVAGA